MLDQFRIRIAALISPELIEQRDQAVRAANVDPLTGIANRRAFDLARPGSEADPLSCVILFDANNFGKLNKQCGHELGDRILVELAQSLQRTAEAYGLAARVFRIGGDEFVILAPCALAEEIRNQAELDFAGWRSGDLLVTVSGTTGRTIAEADRTLQARKRERKGITI